jgi:hypothetical protein
MSAPRPAPLSNLAPLAGVAAGLLYAVKFFADGMPQGGSSTDALTLVKAHEVKNGIEFIATALAALLVVVLTTWVRALLRSGESAEASYSSVAYAGGVLLAAFMLLRAWTILAALDASGTGDHATVQAIGALSADLWLPWMAASCLLLLGTGLGGLRNAVLPRWLAVASIVLGILAVLGPAGFAVDMAMPLWLGSIGVVLRRERATFPADGAVGLAAGLP